MELRHLRYFTVLAEEQNFTRAAMRLHMQQPPLSQQIQALEQELGFELLIRHPKGARLTAAGQAFLEEARAILQQVEFAAQKASRIAQGVEGQLKLGFTSSAAAHQAIPQTIRQFRTTYPHIHIEVREGNAAQLSLALETAQLDAAFLRSPVSLATHLRFHTLLHEDLLVVLPADHVLLPKPSPSATDQITERPRISLHDLSQESFILVRRPGAPGMYANFLKVCERLGFTPHIAMEVERMLSNINLVAAGAGISVVPESMACFHTQNVRYCAIEQRFPELSAPLTLAYDVRRNNPVLDKFLHETLAHFEVAADAR